MSWQTPNNEYSVGAKYKANSLQLRQNTNTLARGKTLHVRLTKSYLQRSRCLCKLLHTTWCTGYFLKFWDLRMNLKVFSRLRGHVMSRWRTNTPRTFWCKLELNQLWADLLISCVRVNLEAERTTISNTFYFSSKFQILFSTFQTVNCHFSSLQCDIKINL